MLYCIGRYLQYTKIDTIIVATIRVEPSVLAFLPIISKRKTINATTHIFMERSFRDLSINVWVVALIVYRFRDKRQKHQHRRLNSYRGGYTTQMKLRLCIFFSLRESSLYKSIPCKYLA